MLDYIAKKYNVSLVSNVIATYYVKQYIIDELCEDVILHSHTSFYSTFDGTDWVCGLMYIETLYQNKATLDDISVAKTELDALLKFINLYKGNKDDTKK